MGQPTTQGRVVGYPAQFQEALQLGDHDGGFMDAVPGWGASLRDGVSGVDAEFVVQDWSADAVGDEGVPVSLDNGSEALAVLGFQVGGNGDDLVKFGLVEGGIPEDAVVALDGEIK